MFKTLILNLLGQTNGLGWGSEGLVNNDLLDHKYISSPLHFKL